MDKPTEQQGERQIEQRFEWSAEQKNVQRIEQSTERQNEQQAELCNAQQAESQNEQQAEPCNTPQIEQKDEQLLEQRLFDLPQIARMLALQQKGMSIEKIADQFQVSSQVIGNLLDSAWHFSEDPDVTMRMLYMYRDRLCTVIDIDFRHEKLAIQNYTHQIPLRAFGVVEQPKWSDLEWFLEDRCFPRTRDHAKDILREMGVPFYDPLLIIEKTQGRMAGDEQWILILKNKGTKHAEGES